MNSIPLISNVPGVNFSMNRGNTSPEVQMRQEINTSLVALKKEAGTLEGLISEASQILDEVNNRIATLENDTVKKNDVVNVVQSGNMNPVTSNAVATSNAMPVNSVTSGNMHSVTSGAVASALSEIRFKYVGNFVANSAVCNDSNLYNVVLGLGSTRMYFLTGWILVKAGTYTSGTKILDLPAKALINQYVIGYEIGTVTPTVYQFYVANDTTALTFNANITLPAMYIQFNQVIITYSS